jgi:hypothetical protein
MNHDEIQDRLEDYVDDRLDRESRAAVDDHLRGCETCRTILDDVAPVDLGSPEHAGEVHIRRSFRLSMFRTIVDAALMLVVAWLALWLLAALVFQPLVVNRSGRAGDAVRMGLDLVSMSNPGFGVDDLEIEASMGSRIVTMRPALPVGVDVEHHDPLTLRIGPLGVGGGDGGGFFPFIQDRETGADAREVLPGLGGGTVATVRVAFEQPIDIDRAQAIADNPGQDIAVVWAGFGVPTVSGDRPQVVLGYGTCLSDSIVRSDDLVSATSASSSASINTAPASVVGALELVREAVERMSAEPGLAADLDVGNYLDVDPGLAVEALDDPDVAEIVVTGPTEDVGAFLSDHPGAVAELIAVDLYNWNGFICGRSV